MLGSGGRWQWQVVVMVGVASCGSGVVLGSPFGPCSDFPVRCTAIQQKRDTVISTRCGGEAVYSVMRIGTGMSRTYCTCA